MEPINDFVKQPENNKSEEKIDENYEDKSFVDDFIKSETKTFDEQEHKTNEKENEEIQDDCDLDLKIAEVGINSLDKSMSLLLLWISKEKTLTSKDFQIPISSKKDLASQLSTLVAKFKNKPNPLVLFLFSIGVVYSENVMNAFKLRNQNLNKKIVLNKEKEKEKEDIISEINKKEYTDEKLFMVKKETRGRKKKIK